MIIKKSNVNLLLLYMLRMWIWCLLIYGFDRLTSQSRGRQRYPVVESRRFCDLRDKRQKEDRRRKNEKEEKKQRTAPKKKKKIHWKDVTECYQYNHRGIKWHWPPSCQSASLELFVVKRILVLSLLHLMDFKQVF